MKFKLAPIFLLDNIEKAFLMTGLKKEGKNITKFLWLKDINQPCSENNLKKIYRFKRIVFGIIFSLCFLTATIFCLNKYNTKLTEEIAKNIYFDNIFMTAQTTNKTI